MTKVKKMLMKNKDLHAPTELIFKEISNHILEAKAHIFHEADKTVIILNWSIGTIINNKIITRKADYGKNSSRTAE